MEILRYFKDMWERIISKIQRDSFGFSFLTVFFVLTMLCFFAVSYEVPVRNVMEARNLRTAEEIVETGNWLFPTLNGKPRVIKPPLPTWIAASVAKLCGDTRNIFFLRIPNVAFALALLLFVYLIAKDIYGRRAAFFTVVFLATSAKLMGETQSARWDLFVCFWTIAALWAARPIFSGCRIDQKLGYFLLASLFAVFSYLSKGPFGFAFILGPYGLAFLIFYILNNREATVFRAEKTENSPGTPLFFNPKKWSHWAILALLILLYLGVGNIWWILSQTHYQNTWKDIFSDVENVNTGHTEPWYYYLERLPSLTAPWILIFLCAFYSGIVELYHKWRSLTKKARFLLYHLIFGVGFAFSALPLILRFLTHEKKSLTFILIPPLMVILGYAAIFLVEHLLEKKRRSAQTKDATIEQNMPAERGKTEHERRFSDGLLFCFLWFAIGLFMLSLMPGKKNRYFLLVLPSCCMFMGIFCEYLLQHQILQAARWIRYSCWIQRSLLCLVAIAMPIVVAILPFLGMSWCLLLLLPFLVIISMILSHRNYEITRLVMDIALTTMLIASLIFVCIPMSPWNTNGYEFASYVKTVTKGAPLYMLASDEDDEMLWAIGRNYIFVTNLSSVQENSYILTAISKEEYASQIKRFFKARSLSARPVYVFDVVQTSKTRQWALYKVKS